MISMMEEIKLFAPNFHPNSRVWIYQSDRPLASDEVKRINQLIRDFTRSWTAHNQALKADGRIFFNRFLVLAVDNSVAEASGCSIDKSTHFLQEIERAYGIHLFDRLKMAYVKNEESEIGVVSKADIRRALEEGKFSVETPVFDNTIQSLEEFRSNWIRPLKDSWGGSVLRLI